MLLPPHHIAPQPSAPVQQAASLTSPTHLPQGHIVTLEITSGQTYRGKLIEAEDNMNVQLKDITVTARDGRVSHLEQVYIRGSHVRFFIVPDMLRCVHLPCFCWFGRDRRTTDVDYCAGTPPCSAAATSAAGVSVSPEEGPRSAGRGLVGAVGGKEGWAGWMDAESGWMV